MTTPIMLSCARCGTGFREPDPPPEPTSGQRCDSCLAPCCPDCLAPARELSASFAAQRRCRQCLYDWVPCTRCGLLTPHGWSDDTDARVCPDCVHDLDQCDHCCRYSAHTHYVAGGRRVCQRCASSLAGCPHCGTLTNGRGPCDGCEITGRVWRYLFKPAPRFFGDGPLFLGMELEVIVPNSVREAAIEVVADHTRELQLAYLKSDSSIPTGGFELVTHPMTYEWARQRFPWQLLTDLRELGCRADESVGIHIHASRAGFDSPAHRFRWMKLVYRNEDDVVAIAGRRTHYAAFTPAGRARAKAAAKRGLSSMEPADRRQAINVLPRNTVELRVFASSLDPDRVRADLAFVAASIEYTRALSVADVIGGAWQWERFTDWASRRPEYAPLTARIGALACAC